MKLTKLGNLWPPFSEAPTGGARWIVEDTESWVFGAETSQALVFGAEESQTLVVGANAIG